MKKISITETRAVATLRTMIHAGGTLLLTILFLLALTPAATLLTSCSSTDHDSQNNPTAAPLWKPGSERNKIVVMSDLHLGHNDAYAKIVDGRPLLVEFLQRLTNTTDVSELILAGDLLDGWHYSLEEQEMSRDALYSAIISNNQDVFAALQQVARSGIKLIYVPGNHDMDLSAHLLTEALPQLQVISQQAGMGAYRTGIRGEIVVEHGHRYDAACAPDPYTHSAISRGSILPIGFLASRIDLTAKLLGPQSDALAPEDIPQPLLNPTDPDMEEQYVQQLLVRTIEQLYAGMLPKRYFTDPVLQLSKIGFEADYCLNDLISTLQPDGTIHATLFPYVNRSWSKLEALYGIKHSIPYGTALLNYSDYRLFASQAIRKHLEEDPRTEVVVLGHTHEPIFYPIGQDKVYVNEGTWIDNNTDSDVTRTFAVFTTGSNTAATTQLFAYDEGGQLRDIKAHVTVGADYLGEWAAE